MSVADGVRRDLEGLPVDLRESGLAAVALAMAEAIDGGQGSRSECGKVVIEALSKLRELAPPMREKNKLDELTERRKRRVARGADSAG